MLDYLVRTEYQGMSRCSMNVRRLSSQGNERWLRVTLPINQANIFLASRSSLLESGGKCRWFLACFEPQSMERMAPNE